MKSNGKYLRDIAMVLMIKLILLSIIWAAFFREKPGVATDEVAAHLLLQAGDKQ